MNRRRYNQALLSTGAALLGGSCAPSPRKSKPNLLFIWTDQQQFKTLRAYGNSTIQVPNLNELAETSCVFKRSYVSQPVCTPSRSTVLTGLYPHQNGCVANNIPLRKSALCFPELLNDPEYRTGYFGKWHLGDENFAQHGFEEWASTENYNNFYTEGRDKSVLSEYQNWLDERGYTPDRGANYSRQFCTELPIEHCKSSFVEEKAKSFIRRHHGSPFVLHVNFFEPHNPYNGPLNDVHSAGSLALPGNAGHEFGDNDPEYLHEKARNRAGLLENDGEKIRNTISRYYGMMTQVDRSVGAILNTVKKMGLWDNTIIVFTSDHGDMLGSHGCFGKGIMLEESSKVPLLIRLPGMTSQKTVEHPVGNIDIAPTLLDIMGQEPTSSLPGQSLRKTLENGTSPQNADVFMEWNARPSKKQKTAEPDETEHSGAYYKNRCSRAIVSPDGWKLVVGDRDKPILYHLPSDPGETVNRFPDSKLSSTKNELFRRIEHWQETTGDKLSLSI